MHTYIFKISQQIIKLLENFEETRKILGKFRKYLKISYGMCEKPFGKLVECLKHIRENFENIVKNYFFYKEI